MIGVYEVAVVPDPDGAWARVEVSGIGDDGGDEGWYFTVTDRWDMLHWAWILLRHVLTRPVRMKP